MNKRIYVCHTYYHVYVTFLKEFELQRDGHAPGEADIILSTISTDFENLKERLEQSGVFGRVFMMDEKKDEFFPELAEYKKDRGNILLNLPQRIIYTKKRAKLLAPYVPVDFRTYEDIYVFCDSDPIGYYLNWKHIYYHAMEDGLDCLKILDAAHYDNRGHFKVKRWMSEHNLIFIQNGYGKYCLDMEINDESCLKYHCPKYKVVPRHPLEKQLTSEQKSIMVHAFIEDADSFLRSLEEKGQGDCTLFLTMPHPQSEEVRKQICNDIIAQYCQGCHVIIKPHPRDLLDYASLRPDCTVIKGKFPVEVLNFVEGVHFKRAISIVTTALDTIEFADEKINLGEDFWDKYEDPDKHKYNKAIEKSIG